MSSAAQAATYKVTKTSDTAKGSCDPTDCSLREAVIAANKNPGADVIIFDQTVGVYQLTLNGDSLQHFYDTAGGPPNAEIGDLDITDHLMIVGAGPINTTIDGSGIGKAKVKVSGLPDDYAEVASNVFEVHKNVSLVVKGVTIQKGAGGFVVRENASLFIGNSMISDSICGKWTRGGIQGLAPGKWDSYSEIIVKDSVIRNNCGGGIFSTAGKPIIKNSFIVDNFSGDAAYPYKCGGIFASQIDMTNSTVSGNKYLMASSDPNCYAAGVDLWLTIGDVSRGDVRSSASSITNSTISGNVNNCKGGGLFIVAHCADVPLIITNSTIAQNSADGQGGGIYILAPPHKYCDEEKKSEWPYPDVTLKNTILANNVDKTKKAPDCLGTIKSVGRNLVRDPSNCMGLKETDKTGIDPLLGPLQDNGGLTLTRHPLPGSPVIDNAGGCPPPAVDQRGIKRPQGPKCDIGAVEVVQKESGTPPFIPFIPHDPKFVIESPISDPPRLIVIKKPPPPPPGPFVQGAGSSCSSNRDGTYSVVNSETGELFVIDRPCLDDGTLPAGAMILLQGTVVPTTAPSSFGQTPETGSCVAPLPSPPNTPAFQMGLSSPDQMRGSSFTTLFPTPDSLYRNAVFGREFGILDDGSGMTTNFCFDSNPGVSDGEVTTQGAAVVTFDGAVNQAVNSQYRIESRIVEPVNPVNPLIMNTRMTTVGTILNCHLRQGETPDRCNENFPADRLDRTTLRSEFTWSVDRFTGDRISEAATYAVETRLVDQFTVLRVILDQGGVGATAGNHSLGLFQNEVKIADLIFERNGIGDSVGRVVPLLQ